MAPLLDNPNDAILPDFRIADHATARARLIANAIEEERDHQQAITDKQEAARKEEQKKNKSKFIPVGNSKVPSIPVVIPSHYAVRKLKAGEYCELYYFTNKGLKDAKKSLLSTESPGLMLTTNTDGLQTWINADEMRDPKAVITKDKNLSWEHFNEATPCMITAMKQHEWPEDRINMHIQFWTALQNHRWRHTFNTLKQRALLLYQSQQRRLWHFTAGGPFGWSIAELNQDLIMEAGEEIFNEDRDLALAALKQVHSL
ncbi:uncharacterized protein F5891DRAFT_979891 [Suillus fuscotomentosus]|uniref:Uncharacterized protein n=1 Tax=Suillus fuscotomentosus TaxID=1912939 RepID=A0AAD4HLM6_9AGAM|nr:uncharacterized protein F5891DRAFT_979891 [Suillus fuscotomentosus]KAG1901002.1 hypothetical protein F5891DRAFT_979891 [Suillus fuscotomentosus]